MFSSGASIASSHNSGAMSVASSDQHEPHPTRVDENEDQEKDSLLDVRKSFLTSVFGVLFTLSKEKGDSHLYYRWVLLKLVLDFWQLFSTVVKPYMGWNIDQNGRAWWWVGLPNFFWVSDVSYNFFIGLLYAMVVLLGLNLLLCVYVAYGFHKRQFGQIWPIKVVRVFSSVFFQAFDVASINLLQIGFSCNFTGAGALGGYLAEFPTVSCLVLPHLVHATVSAVTLVLFISLATLLNVAEVEVNPYYGSPASLGHSGPEVWTFLLKVVLATVDSFIGWSKIIAVIYVITAALLLFVYWRWSPHFIELINHLKVGVSASVFFITVLGCVVTFADDPEQRKTATFVMYAGLVPAGCLGTFASYMRLRLFNEAVKRAFDNVDPDVKTCDIYRFVSPQDVEIAARVGRKWIKADILDPDALLRTELILKAGLARFPNNAFMTVLYSNYLMDGLNNFQAAQRQLQVASKQNPGFIVNFMLFVREQEATQRAAAIGGIGNQLDLVGYVEYHRKQRLVLQAHKEALLATSQFWSLLQGHQVSFNSLSHSLTRIDSSIRNAERVYHLVLEQYSSNTKLLRLYAKFLETVRNDPSRSQKFYAEAAKMDQLHGDPTAEDGLLAVFGNSGITMADGAAAVRAAMDERNSITVVANAAGIIQMVNKHAHSLLGYRKGEMDGKNLNSYMPQPWAAKHTSYLKKYIARGDDRIALGPSTVIALSRDGYGVPVKLAIAKASGMGEDSVFMGMMEPIKVRVNTARIFVLPGGTISCSDMSFSAFFGYHPEEFVGGRLASLLAPPSTHGGPDTRSSKPQLGIFEVVEEGTWDQETAEAYATEILTSPLYDSAERVGEPMVVRIQHRYADPVTCHLHLRQLGTPGNYLLQLELEVVDPRNLEMLLTVDQGGFIRYASFDMAVALGIHDRLPCLIANTTLKTMQNKSQRNKRTSAENPRDAESLLEEPAVEFKLATFLPPPWNAMHQRWLKETTAFDLVPPNIKSCRTGQSGADGLSLTMVDLKGRPFFARVAVSTKEVLGEVVHIVRAKRASKEEACEDRRWKMQLSDTGEILQIYPGAVPGLFGFDPHMLVGLPLWSFVDFGFGNPMPRADSMNASLMGRGLSVFMRMGSGVPGEFPSGNASTHADGLGPADLLKAIIRRSMQNPGCSWQVPLLPPNAREQVLSQVTDASLIAGMLGQMTHSAVMQLFVHMAAGEGASIRMDVSFWPTAGISGLLEIDAKHGCVSKVLEQDIRPANLLFGLPVHSLMGMTMDRLFDVSLIPQVATALQRGQRIDNKSLVNFLLTGVFGQRTKGALKSGTTKVNSASPQTFRVGPSHQLVIIHLDGQTLRVTLQLSGKANGSVLVACIKPLNPIPPKPDLVRNAIFRPKMNRRQSVAQMPRSSVDWTAQYRSGTFLNKSARTQAAGATGMEAGMGMVPSPRMPGGGTVEMIPAGRGDDLLLRGKVYGVSQNVLAGDVNQDHANPRNRPGTGQPSSQAVKGSAVLQGRGTGEVLALAAASSTPLPREDSLDLLASPFVASSKDTFEQRNSNENKTKSTEDNNNNDNTSNHNMNANKENGVANVALAKDHGSSGAGPGGPGERLSLPGVDTFGKTSQSPRGRVRRAVSAKVQGAVEDSRLESAERRMALLKATEESLQVDGGGSKRHSGPATPDRDPVPFSAAGKGRQSDSTAEGVASLPNAISSSAVEEPTQRKPLVSPAALLSSGYSVSLPQLPTFSASDQIPGFSRSSNPMTPGMSGDIRKLLGLSPQNDPVRDAKKRQLDGGAWSDPPLAGGLGAPTPEPATSVFGRGNGNETPNAKDECRKAAEEEGRKEKATLGELPKAKWDRNHEDDETWNAVDGLILSPLVSGVDGFRHPLREPQYQDDEGDRLSDGDMTQDNMKGKRSMIQSWLKAGASPLDPSGDCEGPPTRPPDCVLGRAAGNPATPIVKRTALTSFAPHPPGSSTDAQSPLPTPLKSLVSVSSLKPTIPVPRISSVTRASVDEGDDQMDELEDELDDGLTPLAKHISSGASLIGGSEAGSQTSTRITLSTDNQSTKRYRKLLRLMNGADAQRVVSLFRRLTLAVLGVVLIVHVVCFALSISTIELQRSETVHLSMNERSAYANQYMALLLRALDQVTKNRTVAGYINSTAIPALVASIDNQTSLMEDVLADMYTSSYSWFDLRQKLNFLFSNTWVGVAADGTNLYSNVSFIKNSLQIARSGREVLQNYESWLAAGSMISDNFDFQYVIHNSPDFVPLWRGALDVIFFRALDTTRKVNSQHVVFLVVEACFLASLAAVVVAMLLSRVAEQRYRLYEVFITIPIGLTRSLASKTLHLLDDDEESSEASDGVANLDDVEGITPMDSSGEKTDAKPAKSFQFSGNIKRLSSNGKKDKARLAMAHNMEAPALDAPSRTSPSVTVKRIAARKPSSLRSCMLQAGAFIGRMLGRRSRAVLPSYASGSVESGPPASIRRLVRDSRSTMHMMWPFAVWSILLIALYAACYATLMDAAIPLANAGPINYSLNRVASLVFEAQELCIQETDAAKQARVPRLNHTLNRFEWVYYTILLGKDAYRVTGSGTEIFPRVVSPAVADGPVVNDILFKQHRCFRRRKSKCRTEDWQYYQVTHSGVDAMVQRLILETSDLIAEVLANPGRVGLNSTHLNFMYEVALEDLIDGLVTLSFSHEDLVEKPYLLVRDIHIVLLVICICGVASFYLLLMVPLLKRIKKETHRISELLSQLPRELEIAKVVVAAMSHDANVEHDPLQLTGKARSFVMSFNTGLRPARSRSLVHANSSNFQDE